MSTVYVSLAIQPNLMNFPQQNTNKPNTAECSWQSKKPETMDSPIAQQNTQEKHPSIKRHNLPNYILQDTPLHDAAHESSKLPINTSKRPHEPPNSISHSITPPLLNYTQNNMLLQQQQCGLAPLPSSQRLSTYSSIPHGSPQHGYVPPHVYSVPPQEQPNVVSVQSASTPVYQLQYSGLYTPQEAPRQLPQADISSASVPQQPADAYPPSYIQTGHYSSGGNTFIVNQQPPHNYATVPPQPHGAMGSVGCIAYPHLLQNVAYNGQSSDQSRSSSMQHPNMEYPGNLMVMQPETANRSEYYNNSSQQLQLQPHPPPSAGQSFQTYSQLSMVPQQPPYQIIGSPFDPQSSKPGIGTLFTPAPSSSHLGRYAMPNYVFLNQQQGTMQYTIPTNMNYQGQDYQEQSADNDSKYLHNRHRILQMNSNDMNNGVKWNNAENHDVKRRTKSGCLTCRRRRVKCDELRPQCRNCYKAERVCLGYDTVFTSERLNRISDLTKNRLKFKSQWKKKRSQRRSEDHTIFGSADIQTHAKTLLEQQGISEVLPPLHKLQRKDSGDPTSSVSPEKKHHQEGTRQIHSADNSNLVKPEKASKFYTEPSVVKHEYSNDQQLDHIAVCKNLQKSEVDSVKSPEQVASLQGAIEMSTWKEVAELFRDKLGESIDELLGFTSLYRASGHVVNHFNMKGPFLANVASKVEVMRQMLMIVYPSAVCSKLDVTELTTLEKLHATDEYSILRALIEALVPDTITSPGDIARASVSARYPQARYTRRPEHPRRMTTSFTRIENLAKILYINNKGGDIFLSDHRNYGRKTSVQGAKNLTTSMCSVMDAIVTADNDDLTDKVWECVEIALELCGCRVTDEEIFELSKRKNAVDKMAKLAIKGSPRAVLGLLALSASYCNPAKLALKSIEVPQGLSSAILEIALMEKS